MHDFQGTWTISALETEGLTAPAPMLGASKIVVDGERFTTVSMSAAYGGTMRIDTTRRPMTLDLLFTDGPHKGLASLGIFTIDGDTWTICLGFAGRDRPSAFRTTPGSGHALEVLKREAGGAGSPAAGAPRAAAPHAANLHAAAPQSAAQKDAMAKLGGTWSAVSIMTNGQALPTAYLETGTRVAQGNELTVTVGGQVQLHVTVSVNPSATPTAMDYTIIDGTTNGATMLGIYELDRDTLRTVFAPPGHPRPTTFESTPGDARTLSVWKRQSP